MPVELREERKVWCLFVGQAGYHHKYDQKGKGESFDPSHLQNEMP
jgi:hypothetical protein